MARFLSRLGLLSARHPLRVLLFWLAALAAAITAFVTLGGGLTSSFNIPGTPTSKVTTTLQEQFPELAGATGTIVFRTSDGQPFTAAQKEDIGQILQDVASVARVRDTIDPFASQQTRRDQEAKLADGQAKIDAAQTELDAGRAQLESGQAQLDAAQQHLDEAVAQAQAADTYDAARAEFDRQQAQLSAQAAALATEQGKVAIGQAELMTQREQLQQGTQLFDLSAKIRTVSADEATAVGAVLFQDDLYSLPQDTKNAVADKLDTADIPGVRVDYSSEIAQMPGGVGVGELIGVLIAALVLLIMLRTLLGAVLPLISSLIGVGIGVAGSLSLSNVVSMSSVTPVLGVMLGLAVGIDYSLFIINRHRRQLRDGHGTIESIGLANGTAGSAVLFAGITVIIALLALNVTGIPFLAVMGNVGAACVAIAVLIALTLPPALLRLVGPRILTRKDRQHAAPRTNEDPRPMPTWRAITTAICAVVGLLVIAAPVLSMRLALPDGSQDAPDSTTYRTYTAIADEFGPGQNGALLVLARTPQAVASADVTATELKLARALHEQGDGVAVAPIADEAAEGYFVFQVIPADGPTSESTQDLVSRLRVLSPLPDGTTLGVAGSASANIDVSTLLAQALPVYLGVVIGLSLLIMILVFRSLLVPLIATGGYVLSLFAALGGVVAIFQWGWGGTIFGVHNPGPVLNFAPIILTGVLFGLAMDYQLFLTSGMREEYAHGTPARAAVATGLRAGRTVVTAAAIIMVSVFGGFVFSDATMVRPLGFGLAAGVLLDAFVVRMLLMPAIMHLLGRAAWWLPPWLDRVMPNVDVEGATLERPAAPAPSPVRANA